jgi:transcriptional regulator with XRE-family HTH domain
MTEPVRLWDQWGAAVKARRKELRMTQFDLATASGLVVPTISDIERGAAGGSDQTKMKIAAALGCEVADLFAYPSVTTEAAS